LGYFDILALVPDRYVVPVHRADGINPSAFLVPLL